LEILKSISIDISEKQNAPVVYAVRGEKNSRKIRVSLFQNGNAWIPDATSNIMISYRKSDGRGGMYDKLENGEDAFAFDGDNVVTITLAEQVLSTSGDVFLLASFASDNVITSTFPILVNVSENPGIDVAESNDYFNLSFISLFSVTITESEDGYTADKTFDEIQYAWEQQRYCICLWDGLILPMVLLGAGAEFEAVWSGQLYSVKISESNKVKAEVAGIDGGSGGGVFTVTYTDNEDKHQRIDKTFEEIKSAIDNGKTVQCVYYNDVFHLSRVETYSVEFRSVCDQIDRKIHIGENRITGFSAWMEETDWNAVCEERVLTFSEFSFEVGCANFTDEVIEHDVNLGSFEDLYNAYLGGRPMRCRLTNVASSQELWLPLVEDDWVDNFTFGCVAPPKNDDDKAKRYTVTLSRDPEDPTGLPLSEVLVEEIDNALSIATPETLGGVKPVTKTEDMTQSVGVDDVGGLWTEPMAGGALTKEQINALDGMFKVCAFIKGDVSEEYAAFQTAFGLNGSDDGEETPDETEKTLTSISAVYSGGTVSVGTAVSALTGIVVTAHYSDGTSATVTGYTLSGTIAEGSNTITVSYDGKTTTFTVTGVAESGGEEIDTAPVIEHDGYNLSKTDGTLVEGTMYSVTKYYEFEQLTAARSIEHVVGSAAILGAYDESGSFLDYFSGLASEKTSNLPAGTAKIRFAIADAYIEKAYAYWTDTGEVIFAGKDSAYYGKTNINE
jgi:hypothetical protein